MTLHAYWLYLGAVVLISATPGPNVLYVTTRSIRFGFAAAMLGMSGCLLALAVILTASVAGVSAFMLAVPAAFEALKYAGAAYLIWLGIQAWRAPVADVELGESPSRRETASRGRTFAADSCAASAIPSCLSLPQPSSRNSSLKIRPWRRSS